MVQAASLIAPQEKQSTVWHTLEISETIAHLDSDAENGLSSAVAKHLLSKVGANELTGKKSNPPFGILWKFRKRSLACIVMLRMV